MNVNEVIANRANEMLGGTRGAKAPIHPNDHVNMSQSSNDAFPTAMHIAAAQEIVASAHSGAARICTARSTRKTKAFASIVKIGRTHTQDATPADARPGIFRLCGAGRLRHRPASSSACRELYPLAQGGTAVGTGLNADRALRQAVRQSRRRA